jgi:hypothetical protein
LPGIAVKDGVASLAYAPAIHSLRGNSQKRSGGKLVAMMKGDKIVLHDEKRRHGHRDDRRRQAFA